MANTPIFIVGDSAWVNGFGPNYPYLNQGVPDRFNFTLETVNIQNPSVEAYFNREVSSAEVDNFCSLFLASIFQMLTKTPEFLVLPPSLVVSGGNTLDFATGTFASGVA